jgi:ferredoxin-type protein NapF
MGETNKREAFSSPVSRFKKGKDVKSLPIRPPYNEDNSLFRKHCPECTDTPCVNVCEEDIIKIDSDNIPFLSFKNGGCTFCEECAKACPNEVLILNNETKNLISAKFNIDINSCLAWNEVICSTCRDVCDEHAVEFFGLFRPMINMDKCTACGFCFSVCPPYSIKFESIKEK